MAVRAVLKLTCDDSPPQYYWDAWASPQVAIPYLAGYLTEASRSGVLTKAEGFAAYLDLATKWGYEMFAKKCDPIEPPGLLTSDLYHYYTLDLCRGFPVLTAWSDELNPLPLRPIASAGTPLIGMAEIFAEAAWQKDRLVASCERLVRAGTYRPEHHDIAALSRSRNQYALAAAVPAVDAPEPKVVEIRYVQGRGAVVYDMDECVPVAQILTVAGFKPCKGEWGVSHARIREAVRVVEAAVNALGEAGIEVALTATEDPSRTEYELESDRRMRANSRARRKAIRQEQHPDDEFWTRVRRIGKPALPR